jgi:hypothetical protein
MEGLRLENLELKDVVRELKEDSELTLRFKGAAVPTKETVMPEGSYRTVRACPNPACGEEFWVWAAWVNDELRAETRRKNEEGWFRIPLRRIGRIGKVAGLLGRQGGGDREGVRLRRGREVRGYLKMETFNVARIRYIGRQIRELASR